MKVSCRDKIVSDLLTKRPSGPTGSYIVYSQEEVYDNLADKYRKVIISENCKNFGYSNSDLFNLNLHTSDAAKFYIINRFYDKDCWWDLTKGQKIAVSRRLNRLWMRIKKSVKEVHESGGNGIYKVSPKWSSNVLGHLVAPDKPSALTMAKLFYGHLTNREDARLDVVFTRAGDYNQLKDMNSAILENKNALIKRKLKEIEKIKNRIDQQRKIIAAIDIVESGQMNILNATG